MIKSMTDPQINHDLLTHKMDSHCCHFRLLTNNSQQYPTSKVELEDQ